MASSNDVRVSLNLTVRQIGKLSRFAVSDESRLRIVVSNSDVSNVVLVKARIIGQDDWDVIKTLTGDSKEVINVKTYDEVELESTVFDSITDYIKVIIGSFNEAGDATAIGALFGDLIEDADRIDFTSSDGSITIVTDNATKTIDITTAAGSPFTKYVKTVLIGDWIGPSANEYVLSIPYSFHGVTNPVAACYESNAGSFDLIMVSINVDTSNNITLTATQTPDTRFIGKIVIE